MHNSQSSILLVGTDDRLQATRQWVLQSRSYRVIAVSSVSAICTLPLFPSIQLLVICHTLSDLECGQAVAAAESQWPDIVNVRLVTDPSRVPLALPGQRIHMVDGPAKLLSMVTELVETSAHVRVARRP